jgi:tetratricopeptide (TPR) repeat protein
MHVRRIVSRGVAFTLALSVTAGTALAESKKTSQEGDTAAAPAATGEVKHDPKGVRGISPFWEAIKKGDDALAAHDIEGAKAAYQDAIKSQPQNPMGHYRMGEAELTKGNLKEAEESWQTALRFAGENVGMRAKVLFVLADVRERQRSLDEASNAWGAYETHSKTAGAVKTYPATPTDRKKRIEDWKKLEADYGPVKERIKQRLEEAEKKAAESAQSPQNR